MLILIDLSQNGQLNWSLWTVLGVWTIYIPVQILRNSPHYGWIIIPILGIILSLFLLNLDKSLGINDGIWGYDWALTAVIPIFTFVVLFPITARFARDQPNEYERLEWFVETLEDENE